MQNKMTPHIRSKIQGTGRTQQTGWDPVPQADPEAVRNLTFQQFSATNLQRCNRWHAEKPWHLADWVVAFIGEFGEACNNIKKLKRIEDGIQHIGMSEDVLHAELAREIADAFIYLDLMASAAGVDLVAAVVEKFNVVSAKYDFPERLCLPDTSNQIPE